MDPNPPASRLAHRQKTAAEQQTTATQTGATREFASAEAMIREDAAHTTPPERLEQRVRESIRREPPPPRTPWWRRWLKR